MNQKEGLPARRGIVGLRPGSEEEIGYTNWHAVSARISIVTENLSHRSPQELLGALDQLEEVIPELSGEIGIAKDTLDLPPVHPAQKYVAIIFSRFFPALRNVVRRAELRGEAATRLEDLKNTESNLRDLRQKLSDKIDQLLEEKLRKSNPDDYEECQRIREKEIILRSQIQKVWLLLKDSKYLPQNQIGSTKLISDQEKSMTMVAMSFRSLYKEIIGSEMDITDDLENSMEGLKVKLEGELAHLAGRRSAILEPIRSQFLESKTQG